MLDALLLVAPTPFSVYGVISMWCIGLTAVLATARQVLKLSYGPWRLIHSILAIVIVGTAAAHAFLIEGAMGANSKLVLIIVTLVAVTAAALEMNLLRPYRQRRALQAR